MLVIGDVSGWRRAGQLLPDGDGLRFADLADVTAGLLRCAAPQVVVSPLICAACDVIDIALRLSEAGFTGPYRCIGDTSYDLSMIAQEVAEAAPSLDFGIIEMNCDGSVLAVA